MKWEPTRWIDPASGTSAALRSALRELREQPVDMPGVSALTERLCSQQLPGGKRSLSSAGTLQLGKWFFTCAGLLLIEPDVVEPTVVVQSPLAREERVVKLQAERPSEPVKPPAAEEPSTPPTRVRARKAKRRVQPLKPATAAEAPVATQEELTLLEAAQSALDHDAQRALDLTKQHARDFPAGLFVQEREILALEALLKLAHTREADTRATAFLRAYPDSAHARRVRALLGARASE